MNGLNAIGQLRHREYRRRPLALEGLNTAVQFAAA
jgi:hypothetical protein